jgi:acyl CoA:acetate/3-ketoacid CoA transferase
MGQEEHQLYMVSTENYPTGKINRNYFDFQYIIGKGGFGKVTNNLYNIIFFNHKRFGKFATKEQGKFMQLRKCQKLK